MGQDLWRDLLRYLGMSQVQRKRRLLRRYHGALGGPLGPIYPNGLLCDRYFIARLGNGLVKLLKLRIFRVEEVHAL